MGIFRGPWNDKSDETGPRRARLCEQIAKPLWLMAVHQRQWLHLPTTVHGSWLPRLNSQLHAPKKLESLDHGFPTAVAMSCIANLPTSETIVASRCRDPRYVLISCCRCGYRSRYPVSRPLTGTVPITECKSIECRHRHCCAGLINQNLRGDMGAAGEASRMYHSFVPSGCSAKWVKKVWGCWGCETLNSSYSLSCWFCGMKRNIACTSQWYVGITVM